MPVEELLNGEEVDRWLDILDDDKNPVKGGARIHVKLQYFDVSKDRNWSSGIRVKSFLGFLTHSSLRDMDAELPCWSVYTEISLVRDSRRPKPGGDITIGELLKKKANNGGSIVQDLQISTMFTHHQKIVVVDGDMPTEGSQQRRIVSFVGAVEEAGWEGPPLVQLRDLADSIIPPSPVMFQEDRGNMECSVIRSIDGGAAFGFLRLLRTS
ncbi:hypothetical protein IFM89_003651 [Coptis chinensis]|uniref:Uncharacterized protein n=1 Tax=Coptis chinensis TaxID=261450 RepID=A0A835HIJ0_9MAGN|nr:hypothetical protein IFM89_003651 [Coptis chinensis]